MKITFSADATDTNGPSPTRTLIFIGEATSWGSGTVAIKVKDPDTGEYATAYSSTADFKQEITVGKGNGFQVDLSGSTSPTGAKVYVIPVAD